MDLTKEKDVNKLLDLLLDYEPLGSEVVLNHPTQQEIETYNKTASGLTISSKGKYPDDYVHTVLAVGPECKGVAVGDRVIIRPNRAGGHPVIIIKGSKYVQVSEFTIYGKVKNENKKTDSQTGGILFSN